MDSRLFILVIAVILIVVFFYVILPKLKISKHSGIILRSVIFFGIIGYLSYDFYMKEKYGYLIVFALGAIAFIFLMIGTKKKE